MILLKMNHLKYKGMTYILYGMKSKYYSASDKYAVVRLLNNKIILIKNIRAHNHTIKL